ncbi:acyltransferase family protein [Kineosporia sp. A_224]|uniref:acyltransferase family protein n=1 Tax=Kineosporia sp. A_224 TaxID=1962180 RepID=UPI000B4AD7E0|nr:acyltransferase family protein [Kineosporia sp. A_224]
MALDLGTRPPPDTAARPARQDGLRPDIQGLRALAVGLVVAFHVSPSAVRGGYVGVDVFFVISGFLITSHLVTRPPRCARDLGAFWARRLRRLLPVALLVLLVTLVASRLVAPALTWAATAREAVASALYVENWVLAQSAVDYLAADAQPTAVQHFWSLSVEEQFYLGWPLLVGAMLWLSRRDAVRRRLPLGFRGLLGSVMVVVLAASLATSVHLTATDPARAYFVTPTRVWEFAVGGLLAVVVAGRADRSTSVPHGVRAALAWAGLAAVLGAGLLYTGATPFPGTAALLPVLGTALVIAARADGPGSPDRLWRLPGVRWSGDASYSIYLWHWPLVVLVPAATGAALGPVGAVAVVAATLVLSALTKTHVEDRFRGLPPAAPLAASYRLAAAGMAVVVLVGGAQLLETRLRDAAARGEVAAALAGGGSCFGAAAAVRAPQDCPPAGDRQLVPELGLAAQDRSDAYPDGCFTGAPYDGRATCTYGDGPVKVALVGNSHAGQWLPALQRLAEKNDWTITTYLISYCTVSRVPLRLATAEQERNCARYADWVLTQTSGSAYDLVVTSERQSAQVRGQDWPGTLRAATAAYTDYLRQWADSGATVVVLQDQVVPDDETRRVPECLARNDLDVDACSWPARPPVPTDPDAPRFMDPLYDAARALDHPRVRWVDTHDLLCPDGTCRPVVGGVVTLFDGSHYTATYAATMAPVLDERIRRALG